MAPLCPHCARPSRKRVYRNGARSDRPASSPFQQRRAHHRPAFPMLLERDGLQRIYCVPVVSFCFSRFFFLKFLGALELFPFVREFVIGVVKRARALHLLSNVVRSLLLLVQELLLQCRRDRDLGGEGALNHDQSVPDLLLAARKGRVRVLRSGTGVGGEGKKDTIFRDLASVGL